jgi:hypothetical protein
LDKEPGEGYGLSGWVRNYQTEGLKVFVEGDEEVIANSYGNCGKVQGPQGWIGWKF